MIEIFKNRKVQRFLLVFLVLLGSWWVLAWLFPEILYSLHYVIIDPQAHVSAWLLGILGYPTVVWHYVNNCMASLDIDNNAIFCIHTDYSGLDVILVFSVFIILFRNSSWKFFGFLTLGILLIVILNVIRIVGLSLIAYHSPENLGFHYHFTFVFAIYGVVILLWLFWLNDHNKAKSPE